MSYDLVNELLQNGNLGKIFDRISKQCCLLTHGSCNLEKVLNFTSRPEKYLNSV